MRMRAKLMVGLEPWRVPSSSRVFDGGEPARMVVVKKSVKGFFSGTGTELVAGLSAVSRLPRSGFLPAGQPDS